MSVAVDGEGYLIEPSDWSHNWACEAAQAAGLVLTDEHWLVLHFIRAYYDDHAVPPDARFVIKHLSEIKGAGRNRLFELFPGGYAGLPCKLAGMRRPRIWSTG